MARLLKIRYYFFFLVLFFSVENINFCSTGNNDEDNFSVESSEGKELESNIEKKKAIEQQEGILKNLQKEKEEIESKSNELLLKEKEINVNIKKLEKEIKATQEDKVYYSQRKEAVEKEIEKVATFAKLKSEYKECLRILENKKIELKGKYQEAEKYEKNNAERYAQEKVSITEKQRKLLKLERDKDCYTNPDYYKVKGECNDIMFNIKYYERKKEDKEKLKEELDEIEKGIEEENEEYKKKMTFNEEEKGDAVNVFTRLKNELDDLKNPITNKETEIEEKNKKIIVQKKKLVQIQKEKAEMNKLLADNSRKRTQAEEILRNLSNPKKDISTVAKGTNNEVSRKFKTKVSQAEETLQNLIKSKENIKPVAKETTSKVSQKLKNKISKNKATQQINDSNKKTETQKLPENGTTMLKAMRWCGFFAKPLGSLLWSYANTLYPLEIIKLNTMYFCKYILCVGYRYQPGFMKKIDFFFDVNINAVSVIHSIFCTIIKYKLDCHSCNNKISTRKWVLTRSIFYTIPNSFNFNLNITFKNRYFAINFAGLIVELLNMILLPKAGINESDLQKNNI